MTHLSISLFVGHENGRSFFLNAGKGRCGVGAFFTLYIHFVDWNELDGLIALDWMRYLVPISARGGFSEIFWVIYALGGFWFGWMAVYARTWAGIWSQKKVARCSPWLRSNLFCVLRRVLAGMKAFIILIGAHASQIPFSAFSSIVGEDSIYALRSLRAIRTYSPHGHACWFQGSGTSGPTPCIHACSAVCQ